MSDRAAVASAAVAVVAHRGVTGAAPENTLPAFRRALAVGADAAELDVRLTRDGVPVEFRTGITSGSKR